MFGFKRRSESDQLLSLELNTTVSGNKRTTITRNHNPRGRKRAGMNLYHRADQFLMRFKINEGVTN